MADAKAQDKELYGRQGYIDPTLRRQPMRITERPHQHHAADDTECYDCGRLIGRGEPFVVSALEVVKGVQGRQHRYSCHQACYDIVGRVVMILGKDATHNFDGRPTLRAMWKDHRKVIEQADPELATMLKGAFP